MNDWDDLNDPSDLEAFPDGELDDLLSANSGFSLLDSDGQSIDGELSAEELIASAGQGSIGEDWLQEREARERAEDKAKNSVVDGTVSKKKTKQVGEILNKGYHNKTNLRTLEAEAREVLGTEGVGSEKMGGATVAALQLGRIDGMTYPIQAGIKRLLSGEQIPNVSAVNSAAARRSFSNLIGMDSKDFAKQIKVDESVLPPNNKQDIATIVSMLQNTAGEYLDRGPGKALVNNNLDSVKQEKADLELEEALGTVKDLVDLYIHPKTIGSPVEANRRKHLEESIIDRMINGAFSDGSTSILALPNETGVTGIVRTQGVYGSNQGTPDDRLTISRFNDLYQNTTGAGGRTEFVRDKDGYKVFKDTVTPQERNWVLKHTPSLMNSLIPDTTTKAEREAEVDRVFDLEATGENAENASKEKIAERLAKQRKNVRKTKYQDILERAGKARRILREQMPTNVDEDEDRIRRTGWQKPESEESKQLRNLTNTAAELDLDWSAGQDLDTKGNVKGIHANVGKGSDRGGMYGLNVKSEVAEYVESELEAEIERKATRKREAALLGQFTQGTREWLKQRKGNITASVAGDLLSKYGIENRAIDLAKDRIGGYPSTFDGNADTREGNEGEILALHAFMAKEGKGLHMEEAFFETKKGLEGFGVSPDGRLYHESKEEWEERLEAGPTNVKRKSAGLLELKYLGEGRLADAAERYNNQMQMQMAVSGETQTHFYALDKHTGKDIYELVKADPELQKELIEAGQKAQALSKELDEIGVQELTDRIRVDKADSKLKKKYDKELAKRETKIQKAIKGLSIEETKEYLEKEQKEWDEKWPDNKKPKEVVEEEGQTKAFEDKTKEDDEKPMTAFKETAMQENINASVEGGSGGKAPRAQDTRAASEITSASVSAENSDWKTAAKNSAEDAVPSSKIVSSTKAKQDKPKYVLNGEFVGPMLPEMSNKVDGMFSNNSEEKWTPESSTLVNEVEKLHKTEQVNKLKAQLVREDEREAASKLVAPTDVLFPQKPDKVRAIESMFEGIGSKERWTPEGSGLEKIVNKTISDEQSQKQRDAIDRQKGRLTASEIQADKEAKDKADKEAKDKADEEAKILKDKKAAADKLTRSQNEAAAATEKATRNMEEFGRTVANIGGIAAKGILQGNLSGMDEIRMSKMTGQSEHVLRGMRKELEKGLLGEEGAQKALEIAGQQSMDFMDARAVAKEVGRTKQMQAAAYGMSGIKSLDLSNFSDMLDQDPNEIISYHLENMKSLNPKERSYYANKIAQNPSLASFNYEEADHRNFDNINYLTEQSNLMTERLENTASGIVKGEHIIKEGKEALGSIGEFGGYAATFVAGAAGLGILNYAGKKIGRGFGALKANGVKGKVSNANKYAKASKAMRFGKGALNVAKANPAVLAATGATMGIRHFGDVEDDGGLADSLLDVAEFTTGGMSGGAALGAGVGAIFGGVGAIPGAAIGGAIGAVGGAAVGVGNELWEWATGDDEEQAIPSKSIGNMPSQTVGKKESSKTVNVEVNNSISKDLVVTKTNVDGDLSTDTQNPKHMKGN